ncbi:MAG: DivIVA domain-containing protein [Solirubrobacteraceae bacterium]
MSNFDRPPDTLDEHAVAPPEYYPAGASASHADEPAAEAQDYDPADHQSGEDTESEPRASVGAKMTEIRGRITRALTSFDRGYVQRPSLELGSPGGADHPAPNQETEAFDVLSEVPDDAGSAGRFPVAPFGYHRAAVDEYVADRAAVDDYVAALERELDELRRQSQLPEPPISITEEIERLGEQTASILVVAHDKAHETTRLAQEQAERCVADAASNAVAITEEAKRQLQALDMETDTVWQERARLLEDARAVGAALVALIDEAETRFPEELKANDVERSSEGK